jgi:putative transposase
VRDLLEELDFAPQIRSRGEEAKELRRPRPSRPPLGCERIHSWINRYRSLLTRWSKKPENHRALLKFCLSLITWQQMGVMPLLR